MSLAVLTCFFNFAGFRRPQSNLHRFLRQMKRDGVSVYGLEMSFNGRFLTVDEPHWQQVVLDPKTQTLWQKEAALNVIAKALPPDVTAIAWVDADVWFSNPQWSRDTLKALERHDVVQLFENCHWPDEAGVVLKSLPSCGKVPIVSTPGGSHSGFAWAMRREAWDRAGGLYPFIISGGADSVMAAAFQGNSFWPRIWCHVGEDREPFMQWCRKLGPISVGYTTGDLYHEWHGSAEDRDYIGRAERLSSFHVSRDLEFDKRGLLRWTDWAPDTIVNAAANYFPARKEDGNNH